jgi:hypothetical protein
MKTGKFLRSALKLELKLVMWGVALSNDTYRGDVHASLPFPQDLTRSSKK